MKEQIQKKLNDSKVLRWSVLALVAFTMLCGYFLTDVMSPLKPMLEKELLWDSLDYGIFTSAYGWFNVFAFMLIIGGIILDKMGVRFTGMGACLLMVLGCGLKYYAISTTFAEGSTLAQKSLPWTALLPMVSSNRKYLQAKYIYSTDKKLTHCLLYTSCPMCGSEIR